MSYCIVFMHLRYDLIMAHKEELGQLITLEQGKPLKEAIGEVVNARNGFYIPRISSEFLFYKACYFQVSYGAGFIEFAAEEAKRVYGDIIPSPFVDRRLFVLKQVSSSCLLGCISVSSKSLTAVGNQVRPKIKFSNVVA